MVPCNDNIKNTRGTKVMVKRIWMDGERLKERERNICQAMMTAVTLNR